MSNKILAFAESKDNKFKNPAFEITSAAASLAAQLGGCEFSVITINNCTDDELKILGKYGAKNVFHISLDDINSKSGKSGFLYSHTATAKAISEFAIANGYNIILLSATAFGKEIAPSAAVKTDSAIAVDCVEIDGESGTVVIKRPVYAGKSYTRVKFNSENIVLTLRPNVFKPNLSDGDAAITKVEASSLNIGVDDFKTVVKEVTAASGKLDVAEADRIVSGGRGLRGPENFTLIEKLASVIGGATGASRAVVDAGWRQHGEQVGQTGKTVSPSLYIACGISGAIQHLAGMSSSKCIVAINKDKDAPIFQAANYGIVGDVFEVLPVLTEELKKIV